MRRFVCRLLLLWSFLLASVWANTLKPQFLSADVPVPDRSPQAFQQALPQALAEVLAKVSGNVNVMTLPAVQAQKKQWGSMVQAYTYRVQSNEAGEPDLHVAVQFDGHAIRQLLSRAGQPVWTAARPKTLVWLWQGSALDSATTAQSEGDDPLARALDQAAKQRGLALMFPLMDIEDQGHLGETSHAANSLLDSGELQLAARRYQTTSILAGQISEVGGNWQAHWLYLLDGAPIRWQDEARSPEILGQRALEHVASSMISQLAMSDPSMPDNHIVLQVAGVEDLDQYAMVQEYLLRLSPVNKVSLKAVAPDGLTIAVTYSGARAALQHALQSGHMMALDADGITPENDDRLALRWFGGVNG